jgi:hypothetical protein
MFLMAYRRTLDFIDDRDRVGCWNHLDDNSAFRSMPLYICLSHNLTDCGEPVYSVHLPSYVDNFLDEGLYTRLDSGKGRKSSIYTARIDHHLFRDDGISYSVESKERCCNIRIGSRIFIRRDLEICTDGHDGKSDLTIMLFSIMVFKWYKACLHMHIDLALCYLPEIVCADPQSIMNDDRRDSIYLLMSQAYQEVRCILMDTGMTFDKFIEYLFDISAFTDGRYSNFTFKSFVEMFDNIVWFLSKRSIDPWSRYDYPILLDVTEEQYAWLLINHRDLLTSERDLTIHRIKHFPDTRLFALAPEEQLNVDMVVTYESAPFLTVDRLQKMMNLSDEIRRNAEIWISDELYDEWNDNGRCIDYNCCSEGLVISMFLPFMTLDVIRYVRSIRGEPNRKWIELQSHHNIIDRRVVRRIALICGLEDWYDQQEWMSISDILARISAELEARSACERFDGGSEECDSAEDISDNEQ